MWIDQREAIVVRLSEESEVTQRVVSNVEKQLGRIKGKRSTTSFASQMVQADDRQQRGLTKHLNGFYSKVLTCLRDAECVLVLGPGEAKGEFRKFMVQRDHSEGAITMESADKMTDRQITARVRNWYTDKNTCAPRRAVPRETTARSP